MSAFDPKRTLSGQICCAAKPLPVRLWGVGAMRRRAFIAGLATAVTARPLTARSQQATLPVVGWLNSAGPAANPLYASLAKAFQAALKDAGYVDGQNIQIDFRWG